MNGKCDLKYKDVLLRIEFHILMGITPFVKVDGREEAIGSEEIYWLHPRPRSIAANCPLGRRCWQSETTCINHDIRPT